MKEYSINYEEMLDTLFNGKSYQVKSEYKNLAMQAVKAKFGFRPELHITPCGKYVIITL